MEIHKYSAVGDVTAHHGHMLLNMGHSVSFVLLAATSQKQSTESLLWSGAIRGSSDLSLWGHVPEGPGQRRLSGHRLEDWGEWYGPFT